MRKRRPPSPDRADTAAMLFSGRAQATLHHEHLVARGTSRALVMGEPPTGPNVALAGSTSSASPTARSSSAGDPNGHLDLAPDRRLADLELGGADRAALAQCAEFGQ
jgi:hypothetical protein